MFEQTFVDAQAHTSKPWTVGASLLVQTILLAAALLVPFLHLAVLPQAEIGPVWLAPRMTKPVSPPYITNAMASAAQSNRHVWTAPSAVPHSVTKLISKLDEAPPAVGNAPGSPAGNGGLLFLIPPLAPSPPPQPPATPVKPTETAPQNPLRVTSGIQSAKLMFGPRPAYPRLALTTHTQGTVRIQAIIGRDGAIRNLQIVSGHPLLIEAAKQAVLQWRYQPTLLNGQVVEVITEIDVNFSLSQ